MTKTIKLLAATVLVSMITALSFPSPLLLAEETTPVVDSAALEEGKSLAFNRKKGNCLACHYVQGGSLMGNTGPALIAMKQRFPKRDKLIAQVNDARINNKNTFMPPFGAHGILTEQEINLVVDWLYTL